MSSLIALCCNGDCEESFNPGRERERGGEREEGERERQRGTLIDTRHVQARKLTQRTHTDPAKALAERTHEDLDGSSAAPSS